MMLKGLIADCAKGCAVLEAYYDHDDVCAFVQLCGVLVNSRQLEGQGGPGLQIALSHPIFWGDLLVTNLHTLIHQQENYKMLTVHQFISTRQAQIQRGTAGTTLLQRGIL